MLDKRDVALQLSSPVISMPKFSPLAPLERNGERIVLAANGTFLEVRRPWARVVAQVGPALQTTVPYGEMQETVEYTAGKLPRALLAQFAAWAQQDSGVEIGGIITWNEHTREYALLRSKSNHATADKLDYTLPDLEDGVHVIVDCHSHSHEPAFFSSTDDKDDMHAMKFAFVVGNCNTDNPSIAARLCARGVYKKYDWKI